VNTNSETLEQQRNTQADLLNQHALLFPAQEPGDPMAVEIGGIRIELRAGTNTSDDEADGRNYIDITITPVHPELAPDDRMNAPVDIGLEIARDGDTAGTSVHTTKVGYTMDAPASSYHWVD
jgi:hypothetical protein